MAFSRVKGGDQGFSEPYVCSSLTGSIGELVDFDRSSEVLAEATASSTIESLCGVLVSAVTTADTSAQVQEITDGDEYIADTTNESSTGHNMHRMLLTDSLTVNNAASDDTTDNAVFMQISPVGAASDKKILGRFVRVQDRAA